MRFLARRAPYWVLWCHGESCGRHSGAPASVFVAFENDAVTVVAGQIVKFNSSPGVERGFCAQCGSTLTCATERFPTEAHFHVGAFERAAELAPMGELFGTDRLPWPRPAST